MKKIVGLLMLSISITGNAFAQQEAYAAKPGKIFDLEPGYFKRRYLIGLGHGNNMQVEVAELNDLEQLKNIDTLLHLFLQDIAIFKDSLTNELSSKRIDYIFDNNGRNKLRIQSFQPTGNSFLLQKGEPASLKLAQDTVYIAGTIGSEALKSNNPLRWYRIGFFINNIKDISNYSDGILHEKISALIKSNHEKWKSVDGRWYVIKGDKEISSEQPAGYIAGYNDYIAITAGAGMQNYKNYFTPSFNVGVTAILHTPLKKYDISFSWEPFFMFSKNSAGNLQTFRNDFITISGGFESKNDIKKSHYTANFDIFQHFSLGYLVKRRGDFFDKNTFRLGTGVINWMEGKIKLEPVLYFHDFFKNSTPGIRLSLNF